MRHVSSLSRVLKHALNFQLNMPSKRLSSASRIRREFVLKNASGLEAAVVLFDTMEDVIFCVKDRDHCYVAANDAFLRSAGIPNLADVIGRTAREIFPEILAASYEQQDDEVLSTGSPVRDRLEMITQDDGNVGWFVSQKVAVKNSNGEIIAVAGISRDMDTPAAQGAELGILATALDTLHRESSRPIRIESLAKESGLSWSQFQRRIHKITGLTPRQLLTKSRIEAAAEALRNSEKTLSSIAVDCGFYDQAAFSRQFRSATGLSPSEYRRAFRKQSSVK